MSAVPAAASGTRRALDWSSASNQTKGYLQPSILYHLRVIDGSASARRLAALIGSHVSGVTLRLRTMVAEGLLAESKPVALVVYTLTELGRAEAQTVRRERVEFA